LIERLGVELEMKKDNLRKWMWVFLAALGAIQMYAVRELLAAFAIFVLGFGAIAVCVSLVYFLHKTWEAGVSWAVASRHPVFLAVRRSVAMVEDLARREIRRPGSEPAA
jgi:heme/copper-type cytochrome/quinol oxidase subunit 4